jgi:hypothetical protein
VKVHPAKKRLARLGLLGNPVHAGIRRFVIDGLHPLGGQRAGILDPAVREAVQYAARIVGLEEHRIVLWPIRTFGLFFGIEMIEVAEELVEAMIGRQILVPIAEVVLAELGGRIAEGLERLGNGDVAVLEPHRRSRDADLGEAGALARLAGDEGRAAGRATVLGVIVREHHAFLGKAIDVGRAVAHHTKRIGTDIGLPDMIAEDDKDVGLLASGRGRRLLLGLRDPNGIAGHHRRRGGERGSAEQDVAAVDRTMARVWLDAVIVARHQLLPP